MSARAASQLGKITAAGVNVTYTGLKKAVKNGEAVTADYSIVQSNTITLNGIQYVTN